MCRPDAYPPFGSPEWRAELRAEEAAQERQDRARSDYEDWARELGPMAADEDLIADEDL